MISISMPVRDTEGSIVLYKTEFCKFGNTTARVTRTPTLDGGAVIVHSGISAADRTLNLDMVLTAEEESALKYIYNASQFILVSLSDGFFYGAISEMNINNGKLKATILIKQKEN